MQLFKYRQEEIDHLKRRDNKLGRAIDHIGMVERQVMPDLFQTHAHSVVAQQEQWTIFWFNPTFPADKRLP
jgi:3-methyladenine DNA glycosylase/8-oxoguanine DNA glycosylase